MNDLHIRRVATSDRAEWEPLWQAYLTFYRSSVPDEVTDATFERLVNGAHAMGGMVAVGRHGRLVGLLHYVVHPTTWNTRRICYLEDLFVTPEQRGTGAGRALIEHLADIGRREDWAEIYWMTAGDNAVARRLYDRLAQAGDWVRYELVVDNRDR